jgi:outer membrane protein OmpA-like peptidoglycan-associated protein
MNASRIQNRFSLIAILLSLLSIPSFAQDSKPPEKLKSASLDGAVGLFRAWDAETLRKGEANFSLGVMQTNRDPGEIEIRTVPVAGAVGLHDRLEFFGSVDIQKHVEASSAQTYRVPMGMLPRPATTLLGVTSFSNEAPFVDVPGANGRGDARLGLKFNLFSERRGNPLSMGLVGFGTLPGQRSIIGLSRGLSNGAYQGGFGYLISKRAGRVAQVHINTLVNFVENPTIQGVPLADLQNEFIYRAGAAWMPYRRFQLITEMEGKTYFGTGAPGLNPSIPLDFIIGVRGYLKNWLSVGVGYLASVNHIDGVASQKVYPAGTNGFVAQLALGKRRNDPPKVSCAAASASIKQDEKTAVRASAVDPEGDPLTYAWSVSGGKIAGAEDTVTFDATGVAPGKYTLTATVSDGRHQVTCNTEINVAKNNKPPTVLTEPATATITQGESIGIKAIASDPNNDSLTYSWSVGGERIAADGPSINFGSSGRQPGVYSVAVVVSDGQLSATSSSSITVVRERAVVATKPNQPPTVECQTSSVDVVSGGSVVLSARASDPDKDTLTLTWSSTGGTVSGSGETATFSAVGVTAGVYTVTVTADDNRGGKASCTVTVNVSERIKLIREGPVPCGYFAEGGIHADNCIKAMLDDLALRMKNDAKLRANVIGYTDSSRREKTLKNLGGKRARAVADYLEKKGVESSRLTVTDGGDNNPIGDNKTAAGRKQNRRVEIELSAR